MISGDTSIVNAIARNTSKGKNGLTEKYFYSFATKYCSHHYPNKYPIYDSFVDKLLRYFRDADKFYDFKNTDLKDYNKFKTIYIEFRKFYGLEKYSFKDIDRYLWQAGKDYFGKNTSTQETH